MLQQKLQVGGITRLTLTLKEWTLKSLKVLVGYLTPEINLQLRDAHQPGENDSPQRTPVMALNKWACLLEMVCHGEV